MIRGGLGSPNLGLIGVEAVRAARDARPLPDGARRLAAGPGPVFAVMLTLPAVIGAVAAQMPIRTGEHFGAPSGDERRDMYGRVGVVETFWVLVHGGPLGVELNPCAHLLRRSARRARRACLPPQSSCPAT
jgi:hypothetical protein